MVSYVLVLPNEHFAALKPDGSFVLSDLPDQELTLKLWRPRVEEQARVVDPTTPTTVMWTAKGR